MENKPPEPKALCDGIRANTVRYVLALSLPNGLLAGTPFTRGGRSGTPLPSVAAGPASITPPLYHFATLSPRAGTAPAVGTVTGKDPATAGNPCQRWESPSTDTTKPPHVAPAKRTSSTDTSKTRLPGDKITRSLAAQRRYAGMVRTVSLERPPAEAKWGIRIQVGLAPGVRKR